MNKQATYPTIDQERAWRDARKAINRRLMEHTGQHTSECRACEQYRSRVTRLQEHGYTPFEAMHLAQTVKGLTILMDVEV